MDITSNLRHSLNYITCTISVSSGPPPSAYPYGLSYNPVPIYQSPLYYPKQQWGKDKRDWADWAKEQ